MERKPAKKQPVKSTKKQVCKRQSARKNKPMKGGQFDVLMSISEDKRNEFITKTEDFCKYFNEMLKETPAAVCNMTNLEEKEKCIRGLLNTNLAWKFETECSQQILDILRIIKESQNKDTTRGLKSESAFVKLTKYILEQLKEFTLLGEVANIRSEQTQSNGNNGGSKITKSKKGGTKRSLDDGQSQEATNKSNEIDKELFDLSLLDDFKPRTNIQKDIETIAKNNYGIDDKHALIRLWYDTMRKYDFKTITSSEKRKRNTNIYDSDYSNGKEIIDLYIAYDQFLFGTMSKEDIEWFSPNKDHANAESSCYKKNRNILNKIKELKYDTLLQSQEDNLFVSVVNQILASFIKNYNLINLIHLYTNALFKEHKHHEKRKEIIREYILRYNKLDKKHRKYSHHKEYILNYDQNRYNNEQTEKNKEKLDKSKELLAKKKDLFIKEYEKFMKKQEYIAEHYRDIDFYFSTHIINGYIKVKDLLDKYSPSSQLKLILSNSFSGESELDSSMYKADLEKELFSD